MSKYSVLTGQPIMLGELDKAVLIIKTLGIRGSAQILQQQLPNTLCRGTQMLLIISTLIVQAHQKSLFRQMDSVRHMKTSSNVMIPHLAKKDKRSE